MTTSNTFVGDRASRLLIVQVDEPSKVATVTWELVLAEQVWGEEEEEQSERANAFFPCLSARASARS